MCNSCRPQPTSIHESIPILNALVNAVPKHHGNVLDNKICALCIGDCGNFVLLVMMILSAPLMPRKTMVLLEVTVIKAIPHIAKRMAGTVAHGNARGQSSTSNTNTTTTAKGGGRGCGKRAENAGSSSTAYTTGSRSHGAGRGKNKRARNATSASAANTIANSAMDPFLGKLVAFYCSSEVEQLLIDSFGNTAMS